MNRPERMNALSRELMRGLAEALQQADADENVFVVSCGSSRTAAT
jgi:enoyl-CoA hydratase/carnithine racemase